MHIYIQVDSHSMATRPVYYMLCYVVQLETLVGENLGKWQAKSGEAKIRKLWQICSELPKFAQVFPSKVSNYIVGYNYVNSSALFHDSSKIE